MLSKQDDDQGINDIHHHHHHYHHEIKKIKGEDERPQYYSSFLYIKENLLQHTSSLCCIMAEMNRKRKTEIEANEEAIKYFQFEMVKKAIPIKGH